MATDTNTYECNDCFDGPFATAAELDAHLAEKGHTSPQASWNSRPSERHGVGGVPASDKQVAFIARLAKERGVEIDTDGMSKKAATAEIDRLMALPVVNATPASDKQVAFAVKLLAEKETSVVLTEAQVRGLGPKGCSALIDTLMALPRRATPKAGAAPSTQVTQDGMYRTPDGEIIKVQVAVHGSGSLYAKRLVKLDVPKIVRGKERTHEFVYEAGLINRISPAMKMTLEDAKAWGRLYGACCVCGTTLTDDSIDGSIERGIGPVCGKRF